MTKKIKKKKGKEGRRIKLTEDTVPDLHFEHPIFCLKYLRHKKYSLKECTNKGKIALIDRLHKLSQMTWTEIQISSRHNWGTEKISRNSLPPPPAGITPDVTFLALRYHDKKRMVGFRNRFIFHIVWIDVDYTLYDHGS